MDSGRSAEVGAQDASQKEVRRRIRSDSPSKVELLALDRLVSGPTHLPARAADSLLRKGYVTLMLTPGESRRRFYRITAIGEIERWRKKRQPQQVSTLDTIGGSA
jgi:hypothetical protein